MNTGESAAPEVPVQDLLLITRTKAVVVGEEKH